MTRIQSNTNEFNFKFEKLHSVDMSFLSIGEASAISILNNYLEKVLSYAKDRNDPIIDEQVDCLHIWHLELFHLKDAYWRH